MLSSHGNSNTLRNDHDSKRQSASDRQCPSHLLAPSSRAGATENAVCHLIGVVSVSNGITIKPESKPLGVDVKDKIESAFQRNAVLDARRITVETRGGKVILRGNVHSWLEREQVQWAAWAAPGVSEVESHITINP